MEKTDAELVIASLEGAPYAFEQIVQRYQRLVFNIIYHQLGRRQEVEDVAQEVLLKVFNSLGRFDRRRPLKAWIAKITVNQCRDVLRKRRSSRVEAFSNFTEDEERRIRSLYDVSAGTAAMTETESRACLKLLGQLVRRLSHKDRTAFLLREVEGFGYDEVSKALGTSEVAARIRVSRTRKRLLAALSQVLSSGEMLKT
jgi:RNA polymerase sigma-70 factor (ECF subfamily)